MCSRTSFFIKGKSYNNFSLHEVRVKLRNYALLLAIFRSLRKHPKEQWRSKSLERGFSHAGPRQVLKMGVVEACLSSKSSHLD